ncbi:MULTISPECIES: NAD(P)-dependent oxidoreductase [Acidiplasma]|jgi:D-3-phosphoglycerate dehydrogenase|uniref:3-phosphoglycerate dehydrogenase n=1 Tax=Acidiplasma aeolicum TaxID=507754 RepID=A0A0N8VLK2_9ARCH|nr:MULTISPECIES: NAD(P)-dependent oxidoreductase [Acidiplasma]KPV46440.1 3-phosphoglycerate dehydrogenase [Acidiplasma aeolicum]KQB36756.1 3-phosphoglycerate dehydrogenase [Acidiplasma aeolicum]
MEGKVLICDPVDNVLIEKLKSKFNVEYQPEINRDKLLSIINDYNVVVVRSRTKIDRDIIDRGKNLKIIARAGIGVDNIDTDYAEAKNIKIVYAPGSSTESVVEITLAMMVMGARDLVKGIENTRKNDFTKLKGFELAGKTLGILGYGRIGHAIADAARAFNMNFIAYDPYPVEYQDFVKKVTLEDLLKNSDVLSINVTMRKDSPYILNDQELSMLKKGVIIVNTSRANAINGRDMLKYLRDGTIKSFVSDVFWHEPAREDYEFEMLKMPNVLITPHLGAQSAEAQKRIAIMTAENILKEW